MRRFHDAHVRPPKGGWHFVIGGVMVIRFSESDIVGEIRKWQLNNAVYVSDEAIREELWDYYCKKDPERCGVRGQELRDLQNARILEAAKPVPGEKTPERQGPPLWLFLNTLAAQWTPELHNYFVATCDTLELILECQKCRFEWRRVLAEFPPTDLKSRFEVCRWVHKVHGAISSRLGKPHYPYERMVTEWGAPPE